MIRSGCIPDVACNYDFGCHLQKRHGVDRGCGVVGPPPVAGKSAAGMDRAVRVEGWCHHFNHGGARPCRPGENPWSQLVDTVKSYSGLAAVVVGILVAYLGGRGANLLTNQPTVVTGLMIGTIIGVALFRGVPVGPLIAAGILSLFTQFLRG